MPGGNVPDKHTGGLSVLRQEQEAEPCRVCRAFAGAGEENDRGDAPTVPKRVYAECEADEAVQGMLSGKLMCAEAAESKDGQEIY